MKKIDNKIFPPGTNQFTNPYIFKLDIERYHEELKPIILQSLHRIAKITAEEIVLNYKCRNCDGVGILMINGEYEQCDQCFGTGYILEPKFSDLQTKIKEFIK